MLAVDLIKEIQRLPLKTKIYVVEETLKSIKKEEMENQMELAVEELQEEYLKDKELTAFTSLDLDKFMKQSEIWLIDLDPTKGSEIPHYKF